jgi:hypothetical protein
VNLDVFRPGVSLRQTGQIQSITYMEFPMHNDHQHTSFFNFIHPDHACLPRPVRAIWNTAAVLIFILPFVMACTSCLGIVLGLAGLQAACPVLAQGIALGVIAMVKAGAIALAGLFVTVAFCERHELAQFIRDELYDTIEEDVIPLLR